jgi:hypothetical protein
MMATVREASVADRSRLLTFLLETPIDLGTAFALDRRPDFDALLRLRGQFRTFLADVHGRIAGVITALWHEADDASVVVGEIVDFRVAPWARGGRVAYRLIQAAKGAFESARVGWVVCLIGDHNRLARGMVDGSAGLPTLAPLTRYTSVHLVPWRRPVRRTGDGWQVDRATAGDGEAVRWTRRHALARQRLAPTETWCWPDPEGRHHAWIARDVSGRVIGGLVMWDSDAVRRLRVVRYGAGDQALRWITHAAGLLGLMVSMPPPGDALRLWASRWMAVATGVQASAVVRALVHAALADGLTARRHVLQFNLPTDDPLLALMPGGLRSVTHSTLYGRPLIEGAALASPAGVFHADLALI